MAGGTTCGEPATDVDHVLRKAAGGRDEETNLQSLCHSHHSAKTAREVGWRGYRVG
jgi:5-methylcytosine-specific restriction endonuclease McrA